MAKLSSPAKLLDEELPFQRRQWRIERIGWVVMTVLIVYALAGGLGGGGPLSSAESVATDGSARVRYEKFARQLSPNNVDITVSQSPDGSPAQLHISGSYLRSMTVKSITPEPDTTTVADQGYTFAFKRLPGVTETKIQLQTEPQQMGTVEGWLVINGEKLAIKQFVFP